MLHSQQSFQFGSDANTTDIRCKVAYKVGQLYKITPMTRHSQMGRRSYLWPNNFIWVGGKLALDWKVIISKSSFYGFHQILEVKNPGIPVVQP